MWLRRVIESGEHRRPMEPEDQVALLERLVSVEGLERFLHKAYLGPEAVQHRGPRHDGADARRDPRRRGRPGARRVMIGMAHRGRLNVLAHVVGVSYEAILAEFEAGRAGGEAPAGAEGRLGRREVPPRRRGRAT